MPGTQTKIIKRESPGGWPSKCLPADSTVESGLGSCFTEEFICRLTLLLSLQASSFNLEVILNCTCQSKSKALQHGLQPTRPLRPLDFPGKSMGVGCHRLLQGIITGKYISSGNTSGGYLVWEEPPCSECLPKNARSLPASLTNCALGDGRGPITFKTLNSGHTSHGLKSHQKPLELRGAKHLSAPWKLRSLALQQGRGNASSLQALDRKQSRIKAKVS